MKKIALVTGGAQGIGLACAKALAADGFTPILADINAEKAVASAKELGGGAAGYACDIGDTDQILSLFDQIEADHGPVSVLVNGAGIAPPAPFLDIKIEDFKRVLDINLTGSFVALQRAARTMVEKGIEGSIVNISSINALVAIPTIPAYCASKGGVNQLTKSAALAFAENNIRVNAVGPGSIDTAMLSGVNNDPNAMERIMMRTPLKRIGKPEEIASIVAFLASDKASYVTGETIYADGGRIGMNYTC